MTDSATQQSPQTGQPPQSYVDQYLPPAQPDAQLSEGHSQQALPQHSTPANAQSDQPADPRSSSETLEDQNIFDLLGIADASDEEKEAFLDELQQVIWEDFVEKDVELLLTEDELKEFRVIAEKDTQNEEEKQGQMIDFLEKLIPDLEKIMLEKALDLKEEMTRERIKEYLTLYHAQPEKIEKVKTAQSLADDQKWRSAANTLNALVS